MRVLNRKSICVLLTAIMLVSIPFYKTYARGHIDVNRTCTIMVDIPETWEELKKVDFEVELYKVASVDENDVYTALDDFSDIKDDLSNVGSKTTAEDWAKIGELAAGDVDEKQMTADAVVSVSDGKGKVEVSTGLYLVYARPIETERYGFKFTPYLISAPNNIYAMTGEGEDEWIYDDIKVELKPEQYELFGELEINKVLQSYNTKLGDPVFVFEIEAVDDEGKVVFSDVAAIEFTGSGFKSAVVKDIPAGSHVTVTEVYSGGSYEVTSSPNLETTIVANDKVTVNFTNDYTNTLVYGTGVINHFEYDGTGWEWHIITDNE